MGSLGRSAVPKSLILHIGANKTGSSAIQEFLRLNARHLQEFGYWVAPHNLEPGGEITGHHVATVERLRAEIPASAALLSEKLDRIANRLPDGAKIVLSAENLSNNQRMVKLFSKLKGFEIRVVLFIRRQDELLLSSWQQWESKLSRDFWAWLFGAIPSRGNWMATLRGWEKLVARENIIVRRYNPQGELSWNVLPVFANAIGLCAPVETFVQPHGLTNPSYSEGLLQLVSGNPFLFRDKHDNDFYRIVQTLTADRYRRKPCESQITHTQRLAILECYATSNEWVRKHYFPELGDGLFPIPPASDDDTFSNSERSEKKWEILLDLIYSLAQRVDIPNSPDNRFCEGISQFRNLERDNARSQHAVSRRRRRRKG